MNTVKEILINKINETDDGISLDKFIEISLFEKNGYYRNVQPLGKNGDFVTAPEISQLFGEILGLYIYNFWYNNIQCDFNLIEIGAGKGTLLNDILRINKSFKPFLESININIFEINKKLIEFQKISLAKTDFDLKKIKWVEKFDLLQKKPSIIIANEFFDCLAIKQFIKINNKWYEKKINFNKKENKFYFINSILYEKKLCNKLDKLADINKLNENEIIELSYSRDEYFDKICNFLKRNSGLALIIDYGYTNPIRYSSLQSICLHHSTSILDYPGNQDITSLVNFNDLVKIAKNNNLNIYGPLTQEEFLIKHGIKERKKKILSKANSIQKTIIEKGYKRLIDKKQMGDEFKFLVVSTDKL